MNKRFLIIGAGPTGLGAAYALSRQGHDNYVVCEKNDYVGGLSASFRDPHGFTWDVGGHVVFSHYKRFDDFFQEMTKGEVFTLDRKSYIRLAGRFIPYPFQNNIRYLPPHLLDECLRGLEEAEKNPQPDTSNFLALNKSRLGEGITKLFIQPDNEKRWAYPLDKLSTDWVSDRISPVDLARIRRNIAEEHDDVGWGPNNRFHFPKHGGTGAIFEAGAKKLGERVRLHREATDINAAQKTARFSDGSVEKFDALMSTAPIDLLFAMISDAPDDLKASARALTHADGYIVGIGISKPCPSDMCWIYCPEKPAPFFRATYFSNYSRFNAPDTAHYSLMCDISHSVWLPRRKETIVEETISGLIASGLLSDSDRQNICSTFLLDAPYTYPVPTLERDAILAKLHAWLEPRGIHSRGRFGTWLYEIGNMDHSVVMGMEWADRMLAGKRENVWLDKK